VDCLQRLGFDVRREQDLNEFCNYTITVRGHGGKIPNAGTAEKPLELVVGNAGTAARFLAAMVCLGRGVYRLSGVPRMHERPQAALFSALRELGYRVDAANDKLPAVIHGTGPRLAKCRVSIEQSSQFASALLLCAERGQWQIEIVGENADESPYVAMTAEMNKRFPRRDQRFRIEPDASSGSYFWAVGQLIPPAHRSANISLYDLEISSRRKEPNRRHLSVNVMHWPDSRWQIDQEFPHFLSWPDKPVKTISRLNDLGDSIMTSVVIAPFSPHSTSFTDLGRLRVQECERVVALRTELTKCGARVIETGDTLEVFPSELHAPMNPDGSPTEIETYDDHRMAMCFAVLGLKVRGIKLRNPSCVKKTFPNFFQKLVGHQMHGLGAAILDGHTGRKLTHDELFAA
jgi:3-phosphoshikimate 1-carboxyvinyltransferase